MIEKNSAGASRRLHRRLPVAAAVLILFAAHAEAVEIDTGNDDLTVRWDNTLKYSAATRLRHADDTLLSNPNNDDGDRNFKKGLISDRVDLLSEFDLTWQKRYGFRMSGAAWYDTVYNKTNDNPGFAGGAFPNQTSVPYNHFTSQTRRDAGRDVRLLDGFVFGKFDIGDMSGSVRVGQHSILWGESLFFGVNAIAGTQMPVDVTKLLAVPATQFKEAILPVPMISGQLQLTPRISAAAYLQTAWKPSQLPPVGSYFSNVDVAVNGGEQLLLPGGSAPRHDDLMPKNSAQGGLSMRLRTDEVDYGFYATRFSAKAPQLVAEVGPTAGGPAPTGYYLAYQKAIMAYGVSASRTFGDFNVAIEGSVRHNQDLASSQAADVSALTHGPHTNNTNNPGYAVGDTAHVNVSTLASLAPNLLWREATLAAEVAWNRVLRITDNGAAVDPNATRDGTAARFVLEPTYRSVFPGVDLGVPIGAGWAPHNSRPMAIANPNEWIPAGGGDTSIGIDGSFRDVWRFTLSYTHYYGKAAPLNDLAENNAFSWKQTFADRDFIAASLRYSF